MKGNLKNKKGITLIALVITIIVLLILAGVTIATLTGDNGVLSNATKAKTEDAHSSVKEAISLAYSEYIMELEASKTGETTKIASTQNMKIKGIEKHVLASEKGIGTFKDFLKGKGYIDNNGVINVEKLIGSSLSTGKGNITEKKDVYILEETEDSYTLKYYDDKGSTKETPLWQVEKESTLETKTLDIKYYGIDQIAFTIEYEEGMTWAEWIESEYNKNEVKKDSVVYCQIEGRDYNMTNLEGEYIIPENVIDANSEYFLSARPV